VLKTQVVRLGESGFAQTYFFPLFIGRAVQPLLCLLFTGINPFSSRYQSPGGATEVKE